MTPLRCDSVRHWCRSTLTGLSTSSGRPSASTVRSVLKLNTACKYRIVRFACATDRSQIFRYRCSTIGRVIDASGRNSKAPLWLEALDYGRPKETVINSFLGYASCVFAIPEGFAADWKIAMIGDKPPSMPRAGVLAPIEGHRWMVTLGGYARDSPPTDRDGFLQFARSLRSDLLFACRRDLTCQAQRHE